MRLARTKRRFGFEISIAPLIDVIFLLIIFFMTVTQITRVEAEPVNLPEAHQGQAVSTEPLRLVITILDDGQRMVEGRRMSPDALEVWLRAEQEQAGELSVVIRGDREVAWEHVAETMRVCGRLGISRVRIAVLEAGQP